MNNRGVVIIFALLAITLLSGFLALIFLQTVNETRLVRRHADSTWAIWLAEAGIAKVKSVVGTPAAVSGVIANPSDTTNVYSFDVPEPTLLGTGYYTVVSTGTVTAPGSVISRSVSVTMKVIPPDPSKFGYCVETTGDTVDYKAKNLTNGINSANLVKLNSTQSFRDLFGLDMSTMKANATVLPFASIGDTITAEDITWIDVPSGDLLLIPHLNGNGIVVVNGNFKITGNGTFDGILYVVGTLDMRGTANISGTIFVESTVSLNEDADFSGDSNVAYNPTNIAASLSELSSKSIVSWKEN